MEKVVTFDIPRGGGEFNKINRGFRSYTFKSSSNITMASLLVAVSTKPSQIGDYT